MEISYTCPRVTIVLCVPPEQEHFMPRRSRTPEMLSPSAPLPRTGEVVFMGSSSAWSVTAVVHSWLSPQDLRIEVWLEHLASAAPFTRPPDFAKTQ